MSVYFYDMLYASEKGKSIYNSFLILTFVVQARGSHGSVWVFCYTGVKAWHRIPTSTEITHDQRTGTYAENTGPGSRPWGYRVLSVANP